MTRSAPFRQQGAGLLFFVVMLTIVALSFVLGYAGVMARQQAISLDKTQRTYVAQSISKIERVWRLSALDFDADPVSDTLTAQDVLTAAGVSPRFGAAAVLSRVLVDPASGLTYRVIVFYLPSSSEEAYPFDADAFTATGIVTPCAHPDCVPRVFDTYSSMDLEREFSALTSARLNRIALKAQAYFKARMLQDPEKNISVNYFRKPSGECVVGPLDLDCLDTYTPLVELIGVGQTSASRTANNLGLGSEELTSAWGMPIEASTLFDSVTNDAPFTMAFRARTPAGSYVKVLAVQQL